MWKRKMLKVFMYLVLSVAVLLLAGWIYQRLASDRDLKSYQPVGQLYEVSGGRMHLYAGGQGPVTVVFSAGWGTANPYADFYPLYDKLESKAKFAVYDRFGYGYSDITERKRDIDGIAEEIHQALERSGQRPPYVFAAHSLGSLEAIRFAQKYPEEVKGIVFIEGGSPEYYASNTPMTVIPYVYRFARKTGIARVLYQIGGLEDTALPPNMRELDRVSTLLLAGNRNMTDEIRLSRENAETILRGKKPLDIPITVLTADAFGKLSSDKDWESSQAALSSWSTDGKQIIVPNSSHYLHHYAPDVVAEEILKLAEK
ncbi:alpha/beta fold hydrolase [Cohnella candidum]|uniref:Alpha/beta hydrolase n=1 Tax=Cohnella candidum TaxID=2674991 RepID=A0A3G3K2M8_9BACL|nr:alpha/beta hydrolase [Cohnella candidum]AYQ74692.1 alpha/beta hydrolase [Cohnella candidum]